MLDRVRDLLGADADDQLLELLNGLCTDCRGLAG
jgi:hypothetical protein